jgi:type II secretory ATPase GspE/PulE/Tfp pilus assembly ATPase PilB-like protein
MRSVFKKNGVIGAAAIPELMVQDEVAAGGRLSSPARTEKEGELPRPGGVRRKQDGVLTAPGGELYHLDPSLAEKCALVRQDGTLALHVLASYQSSAEIDSFRRAAGLHLNETIPAPQVATLKVIRDFNVSEVEAQLTSSTGTGSRAKLKDIISFAAAIQINDVKIDSIEDHAVVRLQKDNSLSGGVSRYDMTSQEASALITSAFNYADQGDPVEKPTQDQKFTITDPKKLPANVQTIRGQTAVREDGRRLDLRFIYKSTEVAGRTLADIGLLPQQLESLYFVQNVGAGLFTITAPTDNGKSTTLNLFCIDMVQARGGHIDVIGIDDPVEFMAPEICQLAMYDVGNGEDPFAQKIHTSLRLAPHAIKIGECRSVSTAEASIDAAVTGKLVMTTQHTTGAFGVPFRYERMGVSRHVAYDSSVHVCWMSQRLVPSLCPVCRLPLFSELKGLDVRRMATIRQFRALLENIEGSFFVKGSGCAHCQGNKLFSNPGLKGRALVAEVILPDRDICALLAADREFEARRRTIIDAGMPTIALHGFLLLKEGKIGVEEFMNAIARPNILRDDLAAEEERRRNEGSAKGAIIPHRAVAQ